MYFPTPDMGSSFGTLLVNNLDVSVFLIPMTSVGYGKVTVYTFLLPSILYKSIGRLSCQDEGILYCNSPSGWKY